MLTSQQWTDVKGWIRQEVGDGSFDSWFKQLEIDLSAGELASSEQFSDGASRANRENTLDIIAPTDFMRDWISRHYAEIVQRGIQQTTSYNPKIKFVVKSNVTTANSEPNNLAPNNLAPNGNSSNIANTVNIAKANLSGNSKKLKVTAPQNISQTQTAQAVQTYEGNQLDPRFTFDSFVTGKSNEFAYAAAKRIAESDDLSYNPFFLYGGVGLGKSHLMHAIASQIRETFPNRKVLYISAEKFLHNFIRAIRDKNTAAFKETFRNVDVLMIDDVQFIAGKDATQEEFFHTFEALTSDNKQIILTADKSPHELESIEDRLRSRLGWGLATEIHRPDVETRLAILEHKAASLGVEIPKDVAMLLADKINSNVRELEGALNRLVAHSKLINTKITIDSTMNILRDLFKSCDKVVSLLDIQKKVAEFYSIKISDMSSVRRTRTIARPRQVAMYLSKTLTSKSFPEIGKSFGGRDHTTVMHAVKTIEKLQIEDASIAEDINLLEKLLGNS